MQIENDPAGRIQPSDTPVGDEAPKTWRQMTEEELAKVAKPPVTFESIIKTLKHGGMNDRPYVETVGRGDIVGHELFSKTHGFKPR